jgi:hypothetical protein
MSLNGWRRSTRLLLRTGMSGSFLGCIGADYQIESQLPEIGIGGQAIP